MRRLLSVVAALMFGAIAAVTFAAPASAGPLDPFCVDVDHESGVGVTVCTPWR